MLVLHLLFFFIVVVRKHAGATVNVPRQAYTALHSVIVMEAAPTTICHKLSLLDLLPTDSFPVIYDMMVRF